MLKEYVEYLKDNPKRYWFKAKLYGWGWTPATWEGWLAIAIYILLMMFFALSIDEKSPTREVVFTFILPAALLTIAFIRLTYRKGEKPHWQWGIPKDKK
jgi:hypothetical protein